MSFFEFPHTRTYDSDLGWLIAATKKVIDTVESLNEWKTEHAAAYNDLLILTNSLKNDVEAMKAGIIPESWLIAFRKWLDINMDSIAEKAIAEKIKLGVYFGLTDNGYFIAYIPDSWKEITFDTIMTGEQYGHLTLSY